MLLRTTGPQSKAMGDTKAVANGILATAVDVIASPGAALRAIQHKPTVLVPLCAIIVANAAVLLTYYSEVDVAWLMETGIQASGAEVSAEQREAMARGMENLSPMLMGSIAVVSAAVGLTLWFFLNAAYLTGVSLLGNDGIGLKAWMSMICWCGLPLVFGYGASLANLFVVDATFLPQGRLSPLSFSSLLDLEYAGSGAIWQSIAAMDITALWAMALGVYGYRLWTRRGLVASALIVLAPALLILGALTYFTSG